MAELGWRLMPIKTREKNPGTLLGAAWQKKASADPVRIEAWIKQHGACNWGVLLGPSSGICDVEDDSPEGREILDKAMADCGAVTPCYTSGKSIHRLFLYDERMADDSASIVTAFGTEWRFGDDAAQSVVPPSVHPSGKEYAWLPGLSPDDVEVARLPDSMWQLMLNLRQRDGERKAAERAAKRQETKERKHRVSVPSNVSIGTHTKHVPAAEESVSQFPWANLLTAEGYTHHDGDDWTRPGSDWSNARSATVFPGSDRLQVWTDAGPIDAGHYAKWRFWYQSHGFTDHEQIEAAKEFLGEESSKAIDRAFTGQPTTTTTTTTTTNHPPTVDFGFIDSETFAAKVYTQDWLIDYVLKANQPCIVAGPSKSMKTGFLVELAVSLSSGEKLFGQNNVRKSRVALMSAESGEETLQETAFRVCKSKGVDFAGLKTNLFWSFRPPQISDANHIATLHNFVTANRIEVLAIDPAYLCMGIGDDASNAFKFGDVLMNLTRLANDTGVTPILAAHTNKNCPPGAELELSNIAYSAFPQWARQWFLLNRREVYDKANPGSHKLFVSYGGSAGHSGSWAVDIEEGDIRFGRRWEYQIRPASDVRDEKKHQEHQAKAAEREAEVNDMRQRILDAADMVPKTSATLASVIGVTRNNGAFTAALSHMVADGQIQVTEQNRKNAEPIRRYCTS